MFSANFFAGKKKNPPSASLAGGGFMYADFESRLSQQSPRARRHHDATTTHARNAGLARHCESDSMDVGNHLSNQMFRFVKTAPLISQVGWLAPICSLLAISHQPSASS
jgi:hypothetical protein